MKSAFGIDGYKRIYVVDLQTYKSLDDLNQDGPFGIAYQPNPYFRCNLWTT
jgi:hypothetical protein